MIRIGLFLLATLLPFLGMSQANIKDSSISMFLISPTGGMHLPFGNLSDRFGGNAFIAMNAEYKTKSNFLFSLDGTFLFGKNVKEISMLDEIRDSNGYIIDSDGNLAVVNIGERGFITRFEFGYLLSFKKPNPNSGFIFKFGVGFMQHKIRFDHQNFSIPLLEGEYLKGYDRLTNGIAFSQFVGYRYLSNRRLLNFYFGMEFTEGFTQNRRDYNFDLMGPDNTKRADILMGLRLGWILPLYKQAASEFYYF